MEAMAAIQEFHFESAAATPYMSTPSSPKPFFDDGFSFDFSSQLERNSQPPELTSADELFEQGRIRPLKPSPCPSSLHDSFTTTTTNKGRNSPKKSTSLHQEMTIPISCSCKGSWKWRKSKDFLRKFTALPSPSSSLPKVRKEGGGSGSRCSSFRFGNGGEANRVAKEEMKKKTGMSYRPSFFSCLGFSPALHSLASRSW